MRLALPPRLLCALCLLHVVLPGADMPGPRTFVLASRPVWLGLHLALSAPCLHPPWQAGQGGHKRLPCDSLRGARHLPNPPPVLCLPHTVLMGVGVLGPRPVVASGWSARLDPRTLPLLLAGSPVRPLLSLQSTDSLAFSLRSRCRNSGVFRGRGLPQQHQPREGGGRRLQRCTRTDDLGVHCCRGHQQVPLSHKQQ